MSHRYLFLLSTVINEDDYSVDVSIDLFHKLDTPHFKDRKTFDVAKMIDPDLGKSDSAVMEIMNLRKTFNADRLKGPLMVTCESPIDRDELEMFVKSLDPTTGELKEFIKNASIS